MNRWIQYSLLGFIALFLSIVIFLGQINIPFEVSIGTLYSLIVLYSWLFPGKFTSVYTGIFCSVLLIAGVLLNHSSVPGDHVLELNVMISFVIIWICVILVTITKHSVNSIEKVKEELEVVVDQRTLELEKSEARILQMTYEVQDYAIFLLDINGRIENWNKGAYRMMHYRSKETIGRDYGLIFDKSRSDAVLPQKLLSEAAEKGRAKTETWVMRNNGASFYCDITITQLVSGEKPSGFSIIMHDLTELKNSEAAIEKREQQIRSVFESATDAIVTADQNSKILSWNKAAEKIFGWKFSEVKDKSLSIIMPEEYRKMHSAGMERYLKTGKSQIVGRAVELSGLHKNGRVFPVEISIGAWQVGEDKFFCGIIRDITERKNADKAMRIYNQQLKAQNRELEQFAYIASHDLQEPLRTVSNYSDLLSLKYNEKLGDTGAKSLMFISEATNRMQHLVKGLLEYSRIGSKKNMKYFDSAAVLSGVMQDLDKMVEDSEAEVYWKNLPPLYANETEFRILMQNLITNAIKFRKKNTKPVVDIQAENKDGFIKFAVRDSGIGIAEEYREKIFVIFQRLNSTNEYEGTGIGLAHCRKIVESHGGKIWVESNTGEGSTFYFTIPNLVDEKTELHSSDRRQRSG